MTPFFTRSHRIGRVLGFEVRILYILYIFIGMRLFVSLPHARGATEMLLLLVMVLTLPLSVFLHELGHCLASIKEGLTVRRILLHPLGGVAETMGAIPGPMAEIVIAAAGPFVSLLLAALAFLPLLIAGTANPFAPGQLGVLANLASHFFTLNLILALFNLLPVFPMDGGRIATAISIMVLGVDRGISIMRKVALAGLLTMGLIGIACILLGNPTQGIMLIAIAVVLHMMGRQEMWARQYAGFYAGGSGTRSVGFGGEAEPWSVGNWQPGEGVTSSTGAEKPPGWFSRWRQERVRKRAAKEEAERQALNKRVDEVLAKVKREGIGSLTNEEKDLLNRASQEYRDS